MTACTPATAIRWRSTRRFLPVTRQSSSLWLRGPITSRLFYGVESTLLFTNLDAQLKRAVFLNSHEQDYAKRGTLGLGLGYAPWRRTLLSLDVTGGFSGTNNWWRADTNNSLLEAQQQHRRFWALHAAVQTDVWRGLFVSGSVLTVAQSNLTDLVLYPDRFGRRFTADGVFAPNSQTHDGFDRLLLALRRWLATLVQLPRPICLLDRLRAHRSKSHPAFALYLQLRPSGGSDRFQGREFLSVDF